MKNYEKYMLNWMIEHGYTIYDLINKLDEQKALYDEANEEFSIWDLFNEWEFNEGFNGEIWSCYGEWLENEGGNSKCAAN